MQTLFIADLFTLMGTSEKPSKIEWLMENGVKKPKGVQTISLASDMLPKNLLPYPECLLALMEKFPFLKRISVALNCWPTIKEDGGKAGVAASTFLSSDMYFYPLGVCRALQYIHDVKGIEVDISYHPMLTWPTIDLVNIKNPVNLQKILWQKEFDSLRRFKALLRDEKITDVRIGIENEPMTSDPWSNLTHTGNWLYSQQVKGPFGELATADTQHCGMAILSKELDIPWLFPPFGQSHDPNLFSWEQQFQCLRDVKGPITFHVAQVEDPLRHITPPIRWDDPIMDWPLILRLMQELDEDKGGNVWYGVEIDDGHKYPEGYQHDLEALLYLQEYFGK